MFSDTSTDQLVLVFNYSQFNVRSSATIFTARSISLSGQKIKSLMIIISNGQFVSISNYAF